MAPNQTAASATIDIASVRVPQHVVFRAFVAETVILNLETGQYHGLNPTGGRMIEVLDRVGRVDEAATLLAAEYSIPVEDITGDLQRFCSDLAARGLIEVEHAA
jgi:hypothetical protein